MGWIVWASFILAGVTVLLVVIRPFAEPGGKPAWMPYEDLLGGDLLAEKERLLRAIKDVEFEFQNGSLSPEDRDVLRAQYKRRAVEVIKRIDAEGRSIDEALRSSVEADVRSERALLEEGSS